MANRNKSGSQKTGAYSKFREKKLKDPYISGKGLPEPSICTVCGAIYVKKHWSFDPKLKAKYDGDRNVFKLVCPADRKIKDGFVSGIVNISGKFVVDHKNDIINTIKSEEKRILAKNPTEKIMTIKNVGNCIRIETTSDSLALKIGKVLNRAFKGNHKYKFRYGDRHVEVDWNREI